MTPTNAKLAELRDSRRRWKKLAQVRAQLLQKEHSKNARLRIALLAEYAHSAHLAKQLAKTYAQLKAARKS